MWYTSFEFFGYDRDCSGLSMWINNPTLRLFIKFKTGSLAGSVLEIKRDINENIDRWFDNNGYSKNTVLELSDGKETRRHRFYPDSYSGTVAGNSSYLILRSGEAAPELEFKNTIEIDPKYDKFDVLIEIGSLVHFVQGGIGRFGLVESFTEKCIKIQMINLGEDSYASSVPLRYCRPTNELFVIDNELPDRILVKRLTV